MQVVFYRGTGTFHSYMENKSKTRIELQSNHHTKGVHFSKYTIDSCPQEPRYKKRMDLRYQDLLQLIGR